MATNMRQLIAPTVTLAGYSIKLDELGVIKSAGQTTISLPTTGNTFTVTTAGNQSQSNNDPLATTIYNYRPWVFQDSVTVTISTPSPTTTHFPGYYYGETDVSTSPYTGITERQAGYSTVFVGPESHDTALGGKANYYGTYWVTLSGKDPRRTKSYMYKGAAFVIRGNITGNDNCILKIRGEYCGQMSTVCTALFRIVSKTNAASHIHYSL